MIKSEFHSLGLLTSCVCTYSVSVELMTNMLNTSPLTTSVNAVPWQDYRSGYMLSIGHLICEFIYPLPGGIIQHHCTDSFVDHAVQVVGYDLTGIINTGFSPA